MATIRKKTKKRRLNIEGIVSLLFIFAMVSWFVTQVFVKNYQVELSLEQQQLQEQIVELKKENSTIAVDIQEKQRADKVSAEVESDNSGSYSNVRTLSNGN